MSDPFDTPFLSIPTQTMLYFPPSKEELEPEVETEPSDTDSIKKIRFHEKMLQHYEDARNAIESGRSYGKLAVDSLQLFSPYTKLGTDKYLDWAGTVLDHGIDDYFDDRLQKIQEAYIPIVLNADREGMGTEWLTNPKLVEAATRDATVASALVINVAATTKDLIEKIYRETLSNDADLDRRMSTNFTQLQNKISNQSKEFGELRTLLQEQRQLIESCGQPSAIGGSDADIRVQLTRQRDELRFVKDVMWGQMNATERLKAIRDGRYPNVSSEDIKLLKIAQNQERIEKLTSLTISFGRQSLQLAKNLGLDGKTAQDVDLAIKTVETMATIGVGLTQGPLGYIAAANAAFAFVNGGSSSPQAKMQRQLMNAIYAVHAEVVYTRRTLRDRLVQLETNLEVRLNQIEDTQKIVLNELGELAVAQREQMLLTQKLSQKVDNLLVQNWQDTEKLLNAIRSIQNSVFVNTQLLDQTYEDKFSSVRSFLNGRDRIGNPYNYSKSTSYEREGFELDSLSLGTFLDYTNQQQFFSDPNTRVRSDFLDAMNFYTATLEQGETLVHPGLSWVEI